MTAHEPEVVYFDEDHVETPAEVCPACSDPQAGRWVPASFCPQTAAILAARDPGWAPGDDDPGQEIGD